MHAAIEYLVGLINNLMIRVVYYIDDESPEDVKLLQRWNHEVERAGYC